jgi:cell division inhibitor SepF
MGVFDKFMNSFRVNNDDDYDDDEFYDEDDEIEEDEDEYEEKPKKGFFKRILGGRKNDDDYDDYDDDYEDDYEEESNHSKSFFSRKKETEHEDQTSRIHSGAAASPKVTPMRRRTGKTMEVHVIKPANMEETREIADTLLIGCTVVLNLEGLDVEIAQRVIDFSSGACYSINGSLQKVSSYIFILTPQNVGITGDITDILNSSIPAMRNNL